MSLLRPLMLVISDNEDLQPMGAFVDHTTDGRNAIALSFFITHHVRSFTEPISCSIYQA